MNPGVNPPIVPDDVVLAVEMKGFYVNEETACPCVFDWNWVIEVFLVEIFILFVRHLQLAEVLDGVEVLSDDLHIVLAQHSTASHVIEYNIRYP